MLHWFCGTHGVVVCASDFVGADHDSSCAQPSAPRNAGKCAFGLDGSGEGGMNLRFSALFTSLTLAVLMSGEALAQAPFEFRFEFGTYCG